MSAAVGAIAKKLAVMMLSDPKVLKKLGVVAIGILIIIFMPIGAVLSVFSGDFSTVDFDTAEVQETIVANLSEEETAMIKEIDKRLTAIETAMTEKKFSEKQRKAANVLYVTALYEQSEEKEFVEKLVGCFAKKQTDEQLIKKVNKTFGTDINHEDFTKLMGSVNKELVAVAKSQLGNEGGKPYWSWYGFPSRVEWCACFVSWCADQCGYIESGLVPKFSYCPDGVNWFQKHNRWKSGSSTPTAGMIIFFDWDGDGVSDHVGIVEQVKNGVVYTIEGNSNDQCREQRYDVGNACIMGYGVTTS
jgi:cell wall-associated NlpC family hydrolase